jgi:hypothetical protein
MIQQSTKIKRGVEMSLNGTSVWCELDSGGDCVFICHQQTRDVTKGDTFELVVREELKPATKARKGIIPKPKSLSKEEKVGKDSLNEFFKQMALKLPFHCMNCKRPLYAANNFAKRCVTAHIMKKSDFPSIATNEHNILFLGADIIGVCSCHDEFDSYVEKRISMPIYQTAVIRYVNHLAEHLTEKERIKAEKYLGINQ